MLNGINPVQMYRDRGYAAYVLACGSQAPWQSYYYIKEACKYQRPVLIIQEVYKFNITQDENGYRDGETVNNVLNMPISWDKIQVVASSKADSRIDLLLRFPYIHDDYSDVSTLGVDKFFGNVDYSLGYNFEDSIETESVNVVDKSLIKDVKPISAKNEEYLRKIIEYCKKQGIDLLLINTPCPETTKNDQMLSNYIGLIASEYGVSYIDGNLLWEDIGVDWSMDRADEHGHLNNNGVTKFTTYIENYISEKYPVPDRRGNDNYASYEKAVKE